MTGYASPGPNRDTRKGQYRYRFGNTATNGPRAACTIIIKLITHTSTGY